MVKVETGQTPLLDLALLFPPRISFYDLQEFHLMTFNDRQISLNDRTHSFTERLQTHFYDFVTQRVLNSVLRLHLAFQLNDLCDE